MHLLKASLVLPCAVAAKLPGGYRFSLLPGGGKPGRGFWRRRARPRSCPCLPTSPSESTAPGRITPRQAGHSHSGRCSSLCCPTLSVLCAPGSHPLPGLSWATPGQWLCVYPPLELSQRMSSGPSRAQRVPPAPGLQWLLWADSWELPQEQPLRAMFWLGGDFSNVPERCGKGRRVF